MLVSSLFGPVLELTHNHGTEGDDNFKHFNGNEDGRQGFGHIGFLVDDVYSACDDIRKLGYGFRKVSAIHMLCDVMRKFAMSHGLISSI